MTLSFDPDQIDLPIGHHIGGAFVPAKGVLPMRRPSDITAFADCPLAEPEIVDRAVMAAQTAWQTSGWGRCQPRDRTRNHILPTDGYKSSGIGKDLGREAYHANRRTKSVLIDL